MFGDVILYPPGRGALKINYGGRLPSDTPTRMVPRSGGLRPIFVDPLVDLVTLWSMSDGMLLFTYSAGEDGEYHELTADWDEFWAVYVEFAPAKTDWAKEGF